MEPNYLIDCRSATVSYPIGHGKRRIVLDKIDLKVRQGELLTVVGPSGCGKSTLLRLVLGSQAPDEGEVLVGGKPVKRVTRDCGIVFQNYALFNHLTVLENVMCGPIWEHTNLLERLGTWPLMKAWGAQRNWQHGPLTDWYKVPFQLLRNGMAAVQQWLTPKIRHMRVYKDAREKASEILSICGLDPVVHGHKYGKELSGGMRQRVAIARAMIMTPQILLMDEPFSGLDHNTREAMQEFVHQQWQRGLTIFFVTHNLEEACKLGTRLICLSQHWSEDDGSRGQGARITIDRKVDGGALSPKKVADTVAFKTMVSEIETRGLDDKNLQPRSQFVLTHEDATHAVFATNPGGNV